jgi:hypothetical protein
MLKNVKKYVIGVGNQSWPQRSSAILFVFIIIIFIIKLLIIYKLIIIFLIIILKIIMILKFRGSSPCLLCHLVFSDHFLPWTITACYSALLLPSIILLYYNRHISLCRPILAAILSCGVTETFFFLFSKQRQK